MLPFITSYKSVQVRLGGEVQGDLGGGFGGVRGTGPSPVCCGRPGSRGGFLKYFSVQTTLQTDEVKNVPCGTR